MDKEKFVKEYLKPLILALRTDIIDVRYENTDGTEYVVVEYDKENNSLDSFCRENNIFSSHFKVTDFDLWDITQLILEYI